MTDFPRVIISHTPIKLWGIAIAAAEAYQFFDRDRVTMYYYDKRYKAVITKRRESIQVRVEEVGKDD